MNNVALTILMCLLMSIYSRVEGGTDTFWQFHTNGNSDWQITEASEVSLSFIYSGPFPANDPTINLRIGDYYYIYLQVPPANHRLEIIARDVGGNTANDIVLFAQGSTVGTLESDNSFTWYDQPGTDSAIVGFYMTQTLLNAMTDNSGGVTRAPEYRCELHPSTMRGAFNITGGVTPTASPSPTVSPSPSVSPSVSPTAATQTRDIIVEVLLGKRDYQSGLDLNADNRLDSADLSILAR